MGVSLFKSGFNTNPTKFFSLYNTVHSRLIVASIGTLTICTYCDYIVQFNLNCTRIQCGQESLMLYPLKRMDLLAGLEECYDVQSLDLELIDIPFL